MHYTPALGTTNKSCRVRNARENGNYCPGAKYRCDKSLSYDEHLAAIAIRRRDTSDFVDADDDVNCEPTIVFVDALRARVVH